MVKIIRGKKKPSSKNPSYKGGLFVHRGDASVYKGDKFYIKYPVIDKIALLGNIDDDSKYNLVQRIRYQEERTQIGECLESPVEWHRFKNPKDFFNSRYKYHYRIIHPQTGEYALLALQPKNPQQRYLKLEMNPAKLGHAGVRFIRQWYDENIVVHTFDELISVRKCISRLDLAVDIVGLDIPDMVLNYKESGQSNRWYGKEGPVESYYADAKAGKTTALKIYNKSKPLDAPGTDEENAEEEEDDDTASPEKISSPDKKETLPVKPITRVEKIINTDRALTDLLSLKPHFKDVKIFLPFKIEPSQLPEEEYHWQMFLDCVRNRGFENALKLIPDPLKGQYKKLFKSCTRNIFEPYNFPHTWKDWLEHGLKSSGLFPKGWPY